MGIVYSLVSMIFAGINDFIFKEFTNKSKNSLGLFLSGIGLISFIVFGILNFITSREFTWTMCSVSIFAGFASFTANVLFIRSFYIFPAGVGSTIYRLNLVIVAIIGFLLLHESITSSKITGIVFGSLAVIMMGSMSENNNQQKYTLNGFMLLIWACLLRAIMGILYKIAGWYAIPQYELLTINGFIWLIGGIILVIKTRENLQFTKTTIQFSAISGLMVCGITYFMLNATLHTDASIAIPITQMSFIITCILGSIFHKESMSKTKIAALIFAVLCVIFLSIENLPTMLIKFL